MSKTMEELEAEVRHFKGRYHDEKLAHSITATLISRLDTQDELTQGICRASRSKAMHEIMSGCMPVRKLDGSYTKMDWSHLQEWADNKDWFK
jgi:hypothetical protein